MRITCIQSFILVNYLYNRIRRNFQLLIISNIKYSDSNLDQKIIIFMSEGDKKGSKYTSKKSGSIKSNTSKKDEVTKQKKTTTKKNAISNKKTKRTTSKTKKVTNKTLSKDNKKTLYHDSVSVGVLHNMEDNDRNILKSFIKIWFVLFVFLGLAFASYTGTLAAEGMATFQAHIYDYVYISNIRINGNSNASSVNYSFLDHEMSATVMASTCDGYIEYKIDIVNTTPYKAFITAQGITSQINGNGNPTTTLSAEFTDVTLNDTYINPHSTKTVTLRIKNNCSGSDDQVTIKPNFEYSLYKYFDLTVNSVPNDATVSITTQEGTFTGTGSVTHRVYEGETATFKANKKYYYEGTGSYTMGTNDHTETLTLVPDPHRDLTITPTPDSATVVVKQNNEVICSGTGELVCSVVSGENVTYTVDDPEYYYTESGGVYSGYEETFMMPTTETTKTVTLQERPWITGTTSNSNRTSAATYRGTNWHAGYYLVEAWGGEGAQGDQRDTSGGPSGYVYGVIYIPYETTVYRTAGGNGVRDGGAAGGANGGGNAGNDTSQEAGSGGGYSAFAVGATTINGTNINNGKVKVIAGGGGGSSGRGGIFGTYGGGSGGHGGNIAIAPTSISLGYMFAGADGGTGYNKGEGYGGSTSGGTNNGGSGSSGTLLTGGNGAGRGGGGGAGYYGGGGGSGYRTGLTSSTNYGPAGGGGGSSLLASDVTYSGLSSTITSKLRGTNPSSTGGAVIVTWIGKNM